MNPFKIFEPMDPNSAILACSDQKGTPAFLAGGTNLIDLMKMGVETPRVLVDLNSLDLSTLELIEGNQLRIGAMARNTDVAFHPEVSRRYPLLREAILSGASPQLRNRASVGGNLLQRTRCVYFNDIAFPCNKRIPGSGCPALEGYDRNLAILGTSDHCIASNPSDMNVALAAIEPVIRVKGKIGERAIAFPDFHRLPGRTPHWETALNPGELITSIDLPEIPYGKRSRYLKVRDRASYEFALVSAAVILDLDKNKIRDARVALGGVGTKPWRAIAAEQILIGATASASTFKAAANAALMNARTTGRNAFKVQLAKNVIVRALTETRELQI